ncbi:hypothetical protein GCM10022247_20340 [Allokutzneria multivorans]|uniref:Uncharacterized protein n=1 Tax=Allokutzneria multivorans TaxID=1142134 RepID=A0ABP7RN56_9PSEU
MFFRGCVIQAQPLCVGSSSVGVRQAEHTEVFFRISLWSSTGVSLVFLSDAAVPAS